MRHKVHIINTRQEVLIESEQTLLESLQNAKIDIYSSCGGMGTCGTCRVLVENAETLPPRTEQEQEMASDRGFLKNERLACQLLPTCDLKIRIP